MGFWDPPLWGLGSQNPKFPPFQSLSLILGCPQPRLCHFSPPLSNSCGFSPFLFSIFGVWGISQPLSVILGCPKDAFIPPQTLSVIFWGALTPPHPLLGILGCPDPAFISLRYFGVSLSHPNPSQ